MRVALAIVCAAGSLVAASGCGQAASSSGGSGSAPITGSGGVRELHLTVGGKSSTEWYVKDGPWSTSLGKGFAIVYDGSEYVERFDTTYRLVKGDTGYVHAYAIPFVQVAPGIAIMHAYDAGELTNAAGNKVKVAKAPDGTVTISLPVESDSDTSSTTTEYHIVADPPISLEDARSHGAFAIPHGTPNETITASAPGSASSIGIPAYWFGPKLQDRTARVSVQIKKTTSQEDDISNARDYTTIYRHAAIPSAGTTHGYAAYPGLGDDTTGDVYVKNLLNSERTEIDPSIIVSGRTATPVTLSDGERATLYTWDNPAISPGGGSFVVRTDKVTIEVNYIGQTSLEIAKQLVGQMRPVG